MNAFHRRLKSSTVLASVIAVCCMVTPPYAATYSGGSGTAGAPYLISTPADLVTLSATSADWASQFLMTQDIDMSAVTGFTLIGNSTTMFTGVFDGDNAKRMWYH